MRKLTLLIGGAIGYVLGAKAGRQRYEDIKRMGRQVQDNPKVQGVAGMVQAQAEQVVGAVKSKVNRSDYPTSFTGEIEENEDYQANEKPYQHPKPHTSGTSTSGTSTSGTSSPSTTSTNSSSDRSSTSPITPARGAGPEHTPGLGTTGSATPGSATRDTSPGTSSGGTTPGDASKL